MRALLVPADVSIPVEELELPEPGSHLDEFCEELYRLVDVRPGGLDCARIGPSVRVWVDDEGLLTQRPVNHRLTAFRDGAALAALGYVHEFPFPLVGDGVVVGEPDEAGDDTEVLPWVVHTFREMAF